MYEYHAECLRVIDGDTFDARVDLGFRIRIDMRLRLLAINTPEMTAKNADERTVAVQARDRLAELISGQRLVIRTELDKRDGFGRALAWVTLPDGRLVQDIMLAEGLAEPYMK